MGGMAIVFEADQRPSAMGFYGPARVRGSRSEFMAPGSAMILDNAAYQRRQLLREISMRKQAIEALKGYSFKPKEEWTVMVQMGATPFGGIFFGGREGWHG